MIKRIFDLAVALFLILLTLPLLAVVALSVRVVMGPPVFLRQVRPGLHGRPFTFFKFRTMTDERDASGALLPDDLRLTRFGRRLRTSSLDELPQLFNVLFGDMSLVGPRPLLMEYLPLYSAEQFRRHEVLPGITGLAQISGRNSLSWDERFNLDVWYVDNRSFWLDLRILFMTVVRVFQARGISEAGQATMTRFSGNRNV